MIGRRLFNQFAVKENLVSCGASTVGPAEYLYEDVYCENGRMRG
jgi:hypothetical protein